MLSSDLTLEEIYNALKGMRPDKSPGSDGLTSAFYLKYFSIIGNVLLNVFYICFEQGEMSQKLSYITLLCKDKK